MRLYCWGCNCKVGWGYNDSLDLLIPVEEAPPNFTSIVTNDIICGIWTLSYTNINDCVGILLIC